MLSRETLPYRPHFCVWELTLACNLRCQHCGSRAGRARPDELSTSEAVSVVDQLADLECRLITLSGGEPTLRRDWDVIAARARARDIVVNMVTNGITMTARLAQRIARAGLSNVGISLDGPHRAHEATRGPGSFAKVVRAAALLGDAGVPVSFLTHLNKVTTAALEETHDLVLELGAATWRVQLGKPMGNLSEHPQLLLAPRDLLDLIPRLARLKKRSAIPIDVGDSIGYYGPHEKVLRQSHWGNFKPRWAGCQAGRRAIGIESDGGVKGCLSLQADLRGAVGDSDPFREGTVRDRSLEAIWFDRRSFSFNRQQRPEDLTGFCRRCRHAVQCRGGAKCAAAAFTGGVSENPYCYYRVRKERSRPVRILGAARRHAAAAMVTATLGLGATALGGCLERSVGHDNNNNRPDAALSQDAGLADAEPTDAALTDAEPTDADIEDAAADAEPDAVCCLLYGVLPAPDAAPQE